MKRAISMLGAVAALAIGFMFAVPAAHAQVACTPVLGGTGAWPYNGGAADYTYYCGTATKSNGSGMAGALNSLLAQAADGGAQMAANGAKFRVFKNKTEYLTWFGQAGNNPEGAPTPTIRDEDTGYSHFVSGVTLPKYSVVFTQAKWGDGTTRNIQISYATSREVGFWFSRFYASLADSTTGKASEGSVFTENLRIDWQYLNDTTSYLPCTVPGNVFGGHKAFSGSYICTGTNGNGSTLASPYTGSIQNVLQTAHNFVFPSPEQIFAEEVAVKLGNGDQGGNWSVSYYFRNAQFECTRSMIESVMRYGVLIGDPASPLDLKGNQNCYSQRTSTTGKLFHLYGVDSSAYVTTVLNTYDSLPFSVRLTLIGANYTDYIAYDPDVLRDTLGTGYWYSPGDHADLREHAATTDHVDDRQIFFQRYFHPNFAPLSIPSTMTNDTVGTVAHESEHIVDAHVGMVQPVSSNDAAFMAGHAAGIVTLQALGNQLANDMLAVFNDPNHGLAELFAEIGASLDAGVVSNTSYTAADVQMYFPAAYSRFMSQRSAGQW